LFVYNVSRRLVSARLAPSRLPGERPLLRLIAHLEARTGPAPRNEDVATGNKQGQVGREIAPPGAARATRELVTAARGDWPQGATSISLSSIEASASWVCRSASQRTVYDHSRGTMAGLRSRLRLHRLPTQMVGSSILVFPFGAKGEGAVSQSRLEPARRFGHDPRSAVEFASNAPMGR
jgi:hypothetical protein